MSVFSVPCFPHPLRSLFCRTLGAASDAEELKQLKGLYATTSERMMQEEERKKEQKARRAHAPSSVHHTGLIAT